MQLKPKVAPRVKQSTTTIYYVVGGIVIASIIGIILFIQLNLGNSTDSLAASGTFTSNVSGNWTTNATWLGGTAPSTDLDGDNITIKTNTSILRSGDITGDNGVALTIQSNGTLTINGDLTVKNNLILNNTGTLIITGSLIGKNGAVVTINGGGSVSVGKDVAFENNTSFTVNGSLTVGEDVTFGTNKTFNGAGTVKIVGTGCSSWTGSTPCQSGAFILPVKLLSFKADDNGDGTVNITWSTAEEKNNDYFTLQRSTDGVTFTEFATVKGNGTVQKLSKYDAQDTEPTAERLYYRLSQTDFDGTTETFAPVFVEVKLKTAEMSAYPNPMTGRNLTVHLPKAEAGAMQMLDHRGKVILNKEIDGSSTIIELEFTDELVQGLYYINYKSASGIVKNLKIVKK